MMKIVESEACHMIRAVQLELAHKCYSIYSYIKITNTKEPLKSLQLKMFSSHAQKIIICTQ